jgi:iron complex outermembrane recepter protein
MKLILKHSFKKLVCALGLCSIASIAVAQIEEVVVTATKRGAAAVQDVPIAISAFDSSRLEDMGATQFDQWAGQIPGLNFEDWGPGDKDFVIRGINSPTGATVGVYFDEAVITGRFLENGGGRQADFKLHDIERIEVLKGPQGTLYGANSMSGTIRIIPAKPDFEAVDGYIYTEVGHTDSADGANYNVSGMVNVPLGERAALRLVGWKHENEGYIDNIRYGEKGVNDEDTRGGRATLRFKATEDLTITASFMAQNLNLGNDSRITPAGVVSPGSASPLSTTAFPTPVAMPTLNGGDNVSAEFVKTPWDEEARIYGLTAEWDMGHGSLTATTNLFTRDIDYIYDSTPILQFFNAPLVAITNQIQERDTHSSEIRYSSSFDGAFNFVLGGLYQTEDIDFDLQVLAADANGDVSGVFSESDADDLFIGSGTSIFGRTLTSERENFAIFGEVNYVLTDTISLNLGGRYFDSSSKSVSANTHPFFGFQGAQIDFQNRKTSDSKFTFKANVTYEASDSILLYATVAQGFRPGGTNAVILPIAVVLPEGFDPDELISYEIGAKTSWMDNKVLFNVAAYYTDWKDIQTGNAVQSFSFTDNLGSASVIGAEFDVRYRPNENWDFSAGGSYIETELEDDEPSTVGSFPGAKGDEFPNVPNFSGFASGMYTRELSGSMRGHIRLDLNHKASSATEFNNANPFYNNLGSYTVANMNAGVKTDHWSVTLFVNNLFDSDEAVDIIDDDQEALQSILMRPRTFGLRLNYNY